MADDARLNRRVRALCIGVALATVAIASLGSTSKADTWIQSTEADFSSGAMDQLMVSSSGLSLAASYGREIGLVIDLGPSGSVDSERAYLPFVLGDSDGSFKMWYTGYDGSRNRLLYATSTDGVNWTKQGVAIDIGQPPLYFDGVAGGTVLKDGTGYHMWFTGTFWGIGPAGFTDRIYYATSTDATHWSTGNMSLDVGPVGTWDSWYVLFPSVIQDATGVYRMYYTGGNCAGLDCHGFGIGLATSMDPAGPFNRWGPNPLLDRGVLGTWNANGYYGSSVAYPEWKMYVQGNNGTNQTIGVASSTDGYAWTFEGTQPVWRPNPKEPWESSWVGTPARFGSKNWLYYSGSDGNNSRIGLALVIDGYPPTGNYTSRVFDSGTNGTSWNRISWEGTTPSGTSLVVSVRAGDSSSPDGTWSSWTSYAAPSSVESMPRTRFIQYRAAFATASNTATPEIRSVTITYERNRAPNTQLVGPVETAWVNTTTPVLRWSVSDPDADVQQAFEVQLSTDTSFANALDSGVRISANHSWQTPSLLGSGWYWQVRVEDPYGAWSAWTISSFRIDINPPAFALTSPASGSRITTNNMEIGWVSTDSESGMDHFEVVVDNGLPVFVEGSSRVAPVTGLTDGVHEIKVTAIDRAGNHASGSVSVSVDTNLFTLSGPTHGYLVYGLVAGGAFLVGLAFYLRRKKTTAERRGSNKGEHP